MSSNGHGRRDVDALLASALATGATYDEAARVGGVSKSTVKRRMGNTAFREEVADRRLEFLDALRGSLLSAAPEAVRTLNDLTTSAQAESVRLGAARAILDMSLGRRRGFDLIHGREVERLMHDVMKLVEKRMSFDDMRLLCRELEAMLGAR
jgi:hypothetical protein